MPRWFYPLCGYQNFCFLPLKLGFLVQKWPKLAKYWHFWASWSHARPKNNANKVPRWFFCYVVTKTFASFRKNKEFWPKMTKFCPKYAFLGTYNRPCRFIWCPIGWLVGGCGAQAVSRKTPIYCLLHDVKIWRQIVYISGRCPIAMLMMILGVRNN